MAHDPQSKRRLTSPQWLNIKEKQRGVPKNERSKRDVDNEEATLYFDNRRRQVTINMILKCWFLS